MRYTTILGLVFMAQNASASFQDGNVLQRVSLVNQKSCSRNALEINKETNLVSEKKTVLDNDTQATHLEKTKKVFFETNSSTLNIKAQNLIRELVAQMNSDDLKKIQVIGYADSRGDTDSNQRLSQKRARSVMKILKAQGLPVTKMDVMGGGEKASNNHADARMVEIQIIR